MAESSRGRSIAYWVLTVLFCLAISGSGAFNLSQAEPIQQAMTHLGYPLWLPYILGSWKLAGAAVLLAPGLPRLKEWATAGYLVLLTGASASHLFAGDPPGQAVAPLVLLSLCLGSWALRPASRRLEGPMF
jgi:hypothetical protein